TTALKRLRRHYPEQEGVSRCFARRGNHSRLFKPESCVLGIALKKAGRWREERYWVAATWELALRSAAR
ncbi:MAG TPA: hypothetical protein VI793_08475, partial [Anaerolineales bacterium]|nr:hypothetical protein [Anaerolineales bacterium]